MSCSGRSAEGSGGITAFFDVEASRLLPKRIADFKESMSRAFRTAVDVGVDGAGGSLGDASLDCLGDTKGFIFGMLVGILGESRAVSLNMSTSMSAMSIDSPIRSNFELSNCASLSASLSFSSPFAGLSFVGVAVVERAIDSVLLFVCFASRTRIYFSSWSPRVLNIVPQFSFARKLFNSTGFTFTIADEEDGMADGDDGMSTPGILPVARKWL
jgi:hypothetical protein